MTEVACDYLEMDLNTYSETMSTLGKEKENMNIIRENQRQVYMDIKEYEITQDRETTIKHYQILLSEEVPFEEKR